MTHRFHPLFGRDFEFVVHRRNWGEDRVFCRGEDGGLFSLPAGWTDVARAGRNADDLAASDGDWLSADAHLSEVMSLLPTLVDHTLSLQDRQHHLAQLQGLGADAARAHLANPTGDWAERVGVAWQLLEQARTVLLSQALETRADTTALHTAEPDLAAEYDHLRQLLNTTPTTQR